MRGNPKERYVEPRVTIHGPRTWVAGHIPIPGMVVVVSAVSPLFGMKVDPQICLLAVQMPTFPKSVATFPFSLPCDKYSTIQSPQR